MKLKLKRPLIFFDLETTGTSVTADRIIEISLLKLFPDGTKEQTSYRINPGMPIPPESTAVHHITDEDVKDEPLFKDMAATLFALFDDSDLAGYNCNKFDVPLLIEEFGRAGLNFRVSGRSIVDVQNIFHKMEQRTLVAAYRFYCGRELEDAHSAAADTSATYEVLLGQLDRYETLADDVESLAEFSKMSNAIDLSGRIVVDDRNRAVFNFGKHKGKPVDEVFANEPSYYNWIMQGDFPKNTKDVITALRFKKYTPRKKD